MKRRSWTVLTLAIALAIGMGGPSLAESPDEASPAPATAATATELEGAPMIRGMQLFIDADTGEQRPPTKAEAASMSRQWSEMFGNKKAEPQTFNYKSGMTRIEVPITSLKFSTARIEADGSLTMGCIQGPQRTLEFIESTATTGPAEE